MLCLLSTFVKSNRFDSPKLEAGLVNRTLFVEIVHKIHLSAELKNIVFYIPPHLMSDRQVADNFLQNLWLNLPQIPRIIVINNTLSMMGLLSKPSLCVVMTTSSDDEIMEVTAKSLKRVRYFKTMFLYFPTAGASMSLYEQIILIYKWSWKKQFLNTLLITIDNQFYLVEPFPQLKVVNRTTDWHSMELFPNKTLNVQGMEIRTPVRYDIPRVFCLRRFPNKGRHSKLSGASGKIFGAFLYSINATFNDTHMLVNEFQPFNLLNFTKMVEDGEFEISVHSYTNLINSSVGTSYPIAINDFCIMVPYRNSSPENQFLRRII